MGLLGKLSVRIRASRQAMRGRSRSGAVAIEYALIAPVFFLLLFGIIEIGLIFFGSSVLDKATLDVSRLVKTGQAQNMTKDAFRQQVCAEIEPLLSCSVDLQVDVRSFSSFGGATFPSPLGADGNLDPNLNAYQPGNAGDVVLVRTFYTWNILTPLLAPLMANLANGDRLLSSTAAFRNEPFQN